MIAVALGVFAVGVACGFALALAVYRPRPEAPTAAADALDRIAYRRQIEAAGRGQQVGTVVLPGARPPRSQLRPPSPPRR